MGEPALVHVLQDVTNQNGCACPHTLLEGLVQAILAKLITPHVAINRTWTTAT